MELRGTLQGEKELDRVLLIAASGLDNFTVPLAESQEQLMKTIDMNFAQTGALMGGWAPRKKIYSHPLLDKTGMMRGNFRSQKTKTRLEIWNPTSYFVYHQSNEPRTRLPRRVMLRIIKQDATRINKYFQKYIMEALKGRV